MQAAPQQVYQANDVTWVSNACVIGPNYYGRNNIRPDNPQPFTIYLSRNVIGAPNVVIYTLVITKSTRSSTVTISANYNTNTLTYTNNNNPINVSLTPLSGFLVYGATELIELDCFRMGAPFQRGDFNLNDYYGIRINVNLNPSLPAPPIVNRGSFIRRNQVEVYDNSLFNQFINLFNASVQVQSNISNKIIKSNNVHTQSTIQNHCHQSCNNTSSNVEV